MTPLVKQPRLRGFTLIEVMVSLVLVLLVVIGVSQVFKMSTDAVGAVNAISRIARDNRGAASIMAEDIRNIPSRAPLILISNRIAYEPTTSDTVDGIAAPRGTWGGFPNEIERRNDADGKPETVNNAPNAILPASLSDRLPRLDRLTFVTRGQFTRQTSNNNQAIGTDTAGEAFVSIGHAMFPKGVNGHPQATTAYLLPNDQYASQRVLGRVCTLLKSSSTVTSSTSAWVTPVVPMDPPPGTTGSVRNRGGATAMVCFAPLSYQFQVLQGFRYDVAGLSISELDRCIRYAASDTAWPDRPNQAYQWWMEWDDFGQQVFRPLVEPVMTRPVTPAKLASAAPIFMPHCTQFVVEYAGNFLRQDPTDGDIMDCFAWRDQTDALHNGDVDEDIDYIYDAATKRRRIRWYGMPRNVTGVYPNTGAPNVTVDEVVPLRDVVFRALYRGYNKKPSSASGAPELYPGVVGNDLAGRSAPIDITSTDVNGDYLNLTASRAATFRYISAFTSETSDQVKMIRVTIKLDDPNNRLQGGQWYEYVFTR